MGVCGSVSRREVSMPKKTIRIRVPLRRRRICKYSGSRLGPGSSNTSGNGISMYCRRSGRRLFLAPFRESRSLRGSSNSGWSSILTSVKVDRSAHGGGDRVRNKSCRERFAAARRYDQDVIGPQFHVFCLSSEYLANVHSDFHGLRLPRNLANDPRLLELRRASKSAC